MARPRPVAAKMPQVRFEGARWDVVMCESEWGRFRNDIPYRAYFRLAALLRAFCEDGGEDLPRRSFRWLSRDPADPKGARQGAFEAHGVAIYGRHGITHGRNRFYVTGVLVDPVDGEPEPPPPDRQHRLQLTPPKRGHDHGQSKA